MASGGRPKCTIWDLFIVVEELGKKQSITCKRCKVTFAGSTSAFRLVDHIAGCEAASKEDRAFAKGLQRARDSPKTSTKIGHGKAGVSDIPGWGQEAVTTPAKSRTLRDAEANFFYANNIALLVADDHYFRVLMQEARSTFRPACSHTLRGNMLIRKAAEADVARLDLVRSCPVVSLSCDGWTNVRKEQIIHMVVCTPAPILWKSIVVDVDKCDGAYIATKLLETIKEIEEQTNGRTAVGSIVTDNASTMKRGWTLVKVTRPGVMTFGCAAHCLHLFMKDVCREIRSFSEAVKGAVAIVTVFRASGKLMGKLRRAQLMYYGKIMALFLPGKTRWLSIYNCIGCVLRSRTAIEFVGRRGISDSACLAFLNSPSFLASCLRCAPILRSCCLAILGLESDGASIGKIFHCIVQVGAAIEESGFEDHEKRCILGLFRARFQYLYGPALVTASVLHPTAATKPSKLAVGVARRFLRSRHTGEELTELEKELTEYVDRTGPCFGSSTIWTEEGVADARAWWVVRTGAPGLQTLALAFYATPATSAAAERTFKVVSLIQSKLRNALHTEGAELLAKVKLYLRAKVRKPPSSSKPRKTLLSYEEPEIRDVPDSDSQPTGAGLSPTPPAAGPNGNLDTTSPPAAASRSGNVREGGQDSDADTNGFEELMEEEADDLDHISIDGEEFFDEERDSVPPESDMNENVPSFTAFQSLPHPAPESTPAAQPAVADGPSWASRMFGAARPPCRHRAGTRTIAAQDTALTSHGRRDTPKRCADTAFMSHWRRDTPKRCADTALSSRRIEAVYFFHFSRTPASSLSVAWSRVTAVLYSRAYGYPTS